MNNSIDITKLSSDFPAIKKLQEEEYVFWVNKNRKTGQHISEVSMNEVKDAEARLDRFSSYLIEAFPETKRYISG